jgi:uncharacterized protein
LILYAIQDRRARIEVGYGLEPILPDGKVGGFQREAVPLMRSGDYSGALFLVTSRVADVIAADAGVQLTGERPRAPARSSGDSDDDWSVGVGIFFLIALAFFVLLGRIFSRRSRRRRGWWGGSGFGAFGGFGGFGGGSWGGGGSGFDGFSGGDSGGFGGFGGGSSGGGGASSSW